MHSSSGLRAPRLCQAQVILGLQSLWEWEFRFGVESCHSLSGTIIQMVSHTPALTIAKGATVSMAGKPGTLWPHGVGKWRGCRHSLHPLVHSWPCWLNSKALYLTWEPNPEKWTSACFIGQTNPQVARLERRGLLVSHLPWQRDTGFFHKKMSPYFTKG